MSWKPSISLQSQANARHLRVSQQISMSSHLRLWLAQVTVFLNRSFLIYVDFRSEWNHYSQLTYGANSLIILSIKLLHSPKLFLLCLTLVIFNYRVIFFKLAQIDHRMLGLERFLRLQSSCFISQTVKLWEKVKGVMWEVLEPSSNQGVWSPSLLFTLHVPAAESTSANFCFPHGLRNYGQPICSWTDIILFLEVISSCKNM